jgi:membrane-bound lytic murein transglycosylase MltF
VLLCVSVCVVYESGRKCAEARSLQEIHETHEIRLCVAGSGADYYAMMGGIFAKWLGVNATVHKLESWDQQFHNNDGVTVKEERYTPQLLETGECDVYPNDMHIQEWRRKKLGFVVLFITRMVVLVHQDNLPHYKAEEDLKGKVAAVMENTSYHTWLEEKNQTLFADNPAEIRFMPTNESAEAVNNKTVDFTIIGADGAFTEAIKRSENVKVAFFVGPVTEVAWGVRKEDQKLQEAIQEFFKLQLQMNSEFDTIWKERIGITLSDYTLFISGMDLPGK